jgi:hypothetical protein
MLIFAKIFAIFVSFRIQIFAKSENEFSRNFRENTKTKIFVSTLWAPPRAPPIPIPLPLTLPLILPLPLVVGTETHVQKITNAPVFLYGARP